MSSSVTDRIYTLQNQIHKNVSQVYANKIRCERLCQRIDQLVESLGHSSALILNNLLQCIDDCNNYFEKLKSPEEFYEYKKCEEKFQELNQRLLKIGENLSLEINIQQLFNQEQDKEDQQNDIEDLNEKLDEIAEIILNKQCEQYKLTNIMIDKRFQSVRYTLEQNLLMYTDSYQSKEIIHEHEQILHIPFKDLDIETAPIGNGAFADVYKGKWLIPDKEIVIKIIRINHLFLTVRKDFYREISTMYKINDENILTIFGACIEPNFYAIIEEYMPLGSLYDILYKKHVQIKFNWSDRYSLAWQMSKSINYLHNLTPSILHRDIKSTNFLLKYNDLSNQKYLIKVCDFGLGEIRRETSLQSSSFPSLENIDSICWKAPELLIPFTRHTKQSDIYSLGIVFWELATGTKPWNQYEDEAFIVIQVRTGERPAIPNDVPEQYKQLIEDSWNQEPEERPTCFQLMERIYKEIEQNSNSSTKSEIQVSKQRSHQLDVINEEDEEQDTDEQRLIDSLPDIIITDASSLDTSTEIIFNDEKTDSTEENTSSSSVKDTEQLNPTLSTDSKLENNLEESTDKLYISSFKLEMRSPVNSKTIWMSKKNEH